MQVMDCSLFVAHATCLSIRLGNKLWWENTQVFFLDNLFELAVCKMAAILFRPRVCEKGGKWLQIKSNFHASQYSFVNCYLLIWHMTLKLCTASIVSLSTKKKVSSCQGPTRICKYGTFEIFLNHTKIVSQLTPKLWYVKKMCTCLCCDLFYWCYTMLHKQFMMNNLFIFVRVASLVLGAIVWRNGTPHEWKRLIDHKAE